MSDSSSPFYSTPRAVWEYETERWRVIGNYCVCTQRLIPRAAPSQLLLLFFFLCDTCIYSLGRKGHGTGPLVNVLKGKKFPLCQREFQIIRPNFSSILPSLSSLDFIIKLNGRKRWWGDGDWFVFNIGAPTNTSRPLLALNVTARWVIFLPPIRFRLRPDPPFSPLFVCHLLCSVPTVFFPVQFFFNISGSPDFIPPLDDAQIQFSRAPPNVSFLYLTHFCNKREKNTQDGDAGDRLKFRLGGGKIWWLTDVGLPPRILNCQMLTSPQGNIATLSSSCLFFLSWKVKK